MAAPDHPLTEEHLESINNALAQAQAARVQINLAKSAGIDVSAHEQELVTAETQLRKIKQVYFPGR